MVLLYSNIRAAVPREGLSCGYKRKAAMKKKAQKSPEETETDKQFGGRKPHTYKQLSEIL